MTSYEKTLKLCSPAAIVFLFILTLLAVLIPPTAYIIFHNVPTVSLDDVMVTLKNSPEKTVLLDIREKDKFKKEHISRAINIPYTVILHQNPSKAQMKMLQGKKVYVLCESGIASAAVTRKLRQKNIKAFNIKGGLEAWVASANHKYGEAFSFKTESSVIKPPPFRKASPFEQWVAVLTGFVIKPIYTLLSLLLIIWLRKSGEIELKALKYAMVFFFLGENCCAANYLFFDHESYLLEYLHSVGMLLCFGFAMYGVLEGIDKYAVQYSTPNKKCALLSLCAHCIKFENVPCALQRCFIFISLACAAVALVPICAPLKMISYNTVIWKTSYNYSHPVIYQIFEVRYCPFLASGLFLLTSLILWLRPKNYLNLSKITFAAAGGPLSFSFFRFILFHGFQENLVWMEFWEEITEFIFIAAVAFILWQFRQSLFEKKD